MSFFDAVSGFFDGGVGDLIGTALEVGGDVFNAVQSNNANEEAARRIAEANELALRRQEEAAARAREEFAAFRAASEPGLNYLRGQVVADPYDLTSFQRLAREDAQRNARAGVAASGLRGSGRSGVAAIQLADQDFLARVADSNRRRSDSAASQLSNQGLQAAGATAGIETGVGRAGATEAINTGLADAGATTQNADNIGVAGSTIAAAISNELRRQGRDPRYGERPSET